MIRLSLSQAHNTAQASAGSALGAVGVGLAAAGIVVGFLYLFATCQPRFGHLSATRLRRAAPASTVAGLLALAAGVYYS